MWDIPKKRLLELRDARVERLLREQEKQEESMKAQERAAIQNQILAP